MSWQKKFLTTASMTLLTVVSLADPIWAVPMTKYAEPSDGMNFVYTITESKFEGQSLLVPQTETMGFWLVTLNTFSAAQGSNFKNDTLNFSGTAEHLRGPVDDVHPPNDEKFHFRFDLEEDVFTHSQSDVLPHDGHSDVFKATLAPDIDFHGAGRGGAVDILSYVFVLTGNHLPQAAPAPEPPTFLLLGIATVGLGLAARWRRPRQG